MRIKIRLSFNCILQYVLMYLFFISHDAAIYRENTMIFRIGIISFCISMIMSERLRRLSRDYVLFIAMVSFYLLLRGEQKLWLNYFEYILLIYTTYTINEKMFCERFVRMTMFFTYISLVFYVVGLIAPNLLSHIPENKVAWSRWGQEYYMQGRFLYTVRRLELERNNSIFTEPGLFQMFLNSALFIILFMRESLANINDKKINRYIFMLMIAIITTGSTTGYLACGMIICTFVINHKAVIKQETNRIRIKKIFNLVTGISITLLFILFADYGINQENSLLNKFFITKILEVFSDGTSGHARASKMAICMTILKEYPLGAGESYVSAILKMLDDGANGGMLIHSFASIGLVPVLLILYPYFKNMLKSYVPYLNKLLILAIYLNTVLAQSRLLYPALLILPLIYGKYCLNIGQKMELKNE